MTLTFPSYQSSDLFLGKQALVLNKSTHSLTLAKKTNAKQQLAVANYFIQKIQDLRGGTLHCSNDQKLHLIRIADLFLKASVIDPKTLKARSVKNLYSKDFARALEKLDRYVTAEKFPFLKRSQPISTESIASLFITDEAKSSLKAWVALTTHRGIKQASTQLTDKVINSELAAEAFLHHPEETDHNMTKLARQIGRFNEHIHIDPMTFYHSIVHEGKITPLASIGLQKIKDDNYCYRELVGFSHFNRSSFTGEIPPFRTRRGARDDNDYKLVIKSIADGPDNHAWLELKSPEFVYNFGFYFTKESDKELSPLLSKCKTVFGEMRTPDSKEFKGKDDKIVKTVSLITKEQFEALKKHVEEFQNQKDPKVYNMVNNNCCSFVRKTLASIGVNLPSQGNFSYYLSGKDTKLFFSKIPLLSTIERLVHRALVLIRNLVMLIGGGVSACRGLKNKGLNLFSSFKDFFSAKVSEIDLPKKIQQWQSALAHKRADAVKALKSSPEYQKMTQDQKIENERKLMLKLPIDPVLPEIITTL